MGTTIVLTIKLNLIGGLVGFAIALGNQVRLRLLTVSLSFALSLPVSRCGAFSNKGKKKPISFFTELIDNTFFFQK